MILFDPGDPFETGLITVSLNVSLVYWYKDLNQKSLTYRE